MAVRKIAEALRAGLVPHEARNETDDTTLATRIGGTDARAETAGLLTNSPLFVLAPGACSDGPQASERPCACTRLTISRRLRRLLFRAFPSPHLRRLSLPSISRVLFWGGRKRPPEVPSKAFPQESVGWPVARSR